MMFNISKSAISLSVNQTNPPSRNSCDIAHPYIQIICIKIHHITPFLIFVIPNFALPYLLEIIEIPPFKPSSINKYMSGSVSNSRSTRVIFRQAFQLTPGWVWLMMVQACVALAIFWRWIFSTDKGLLQNST